MNLKSICKKIASIGLAAALVVSGITYQPGTAKAAAELPKVTVLGATLSLDADAGCQSMRVAIQVTNADNASACGMDIKYGTKTIKFSTKNDGQNKLYDYDLKNNTVVYAVKIKNIPVGNFADNFTISGFATPIDGNNGEDVTTGEPVTKSVNGVVEAIKTATGLDNLVIAADGSLLVEEEGFDVDLSAIDCEKLSVKYDDEVGGLVGKDAGNFHFPIGRTIEKGYAADVIMEGSKTGSQVLRTYLTPGYDSSAVEAYPTFNGDSLKQKFTWQLKNNATYMMVKAGGPGQSAKFDSITITRISFDRIYKKLTASDIGDTKLVKNVDVKLCADTAVAPGTLYYYFDSSKNVYNNDGSVTFNLWDENHLDYNLVNAFYFLEDKSGLNMKDYSKVEIVASANESGVGVICAVVKNAKLKVEPDSECINMTSKKINDTDTTITIPLDNVVTDTKGYGISMQHTTWSTIQSKKPVITIKSIKLVK